MIDLNRVIKSYGEQRVLDDVSLTFQPGRTTALIGPSGCGKSTLLRTIIGLVRPEAGQVHFEGTELDHVTAHLRAVRLRVGYVIQDGGLFPHLTARDNATLMARRLRWPAHRIDQRVDELVTLTHFPRDGLNRFPAHLSGGQRQRVALMRALFLDPDVLLLDEPLGSLDPMIRYELQADLRQIFRDLGKTVVIVTHDLAEAGYFADRVVLMRDGRIVQQGSIDDLITRPANAFVTRFITTQRGHLHPRDQHAEDPR